MMTAAFACGDQTEYNERQGTHTVQIDKETLSADLEELEAQIAQQTVPDEQLLEKAISLFQDFAAAFPDDPQSPDYLLKAADFSMAIRRVEKSVKLLDRIIEQYPNYTKLEDVMYVKASHLDFDLRDTTAAKEAYRAFVDRFPASKMVEDARMRMANISLSMEELVEQFTRQSEMLPQ